MKVLQDAADKQDWAYLIMHQYYCMLTTCPEAVPDNVKNSPTLHWALRILHDVLQPNTMLSQLSVSLANNSCHVGSSF